MVTAKSLSFFVSVGNEVSDAEWAAVSALFSSEYGVYSAAAPSRAGERIRLGVAYYRRAYANGQYRVALCRDGDRLVAHAIYLERMTSRGQVALVVQLVVAGPYRRQGIASTLLHAIWGFSNYYAWGIVSSNAFTIEALESATFRKASPAVMAESENWLREEVMSGVPFLAQAERRLSGDEAIVNTAFFTDRTQSGESTADIRARLGELAEGEEWLAVVFRHQEPDDLSAYRSMIAASGEIVRAAYRHMPQNEQRWASRTADEIDVVLNAVPALAKDALLVDFGAGSGRHVAELRKRGYANAIGIDFATETNEFVRTGDCREWRSEKPVDLALCLYDVVGSFPDDVSNEAVMKNVADNLDDGGWAVFSVSNWDFLDRHEVRAIDFDEESTAVRALFDLPSTKTMHDSGEFFDGKCILVDERRRLVCHKEQFPFGKGLPSGEFLIRDRRFTAAEISTWLEAAGLEVVQTRFVRAGFKVEYAVSTGKEILLFAKKGSK